MSQPLPTNPIVIVGCRRSGTTLLRTMLDRHPDLLVHPDEPQFFLELYQQFGYTIHDLKQALAHVENHPYRAQNWEQIVTAYQEATAPLPLAEFSQCYLSGWRSDKKAKQRFVLKHPKLIFHLDVVQTLFPQVTIIHVVRDSRANVASQRAKWPKATIWECAMWWRNAVRAGKTWQHSQRSPYIEVQYENLILEPAETLSSLCRNLDIDFDANMLHFELRSKYFVPNAPPEQVKLTTVDPTRLNLWQKRLTPIEIKIIESICAQEMKQWNYSVQDPHVSSFSLAIRSAKEQCHYKLLTTMRRLKKRSL